MVQILRLEHLLKRVESLHFNDSGSSKLEPGRIRVTAPSELRAPHEGRNQKLAKSCPLLFRPHEVHDQLSHVALQIFHVALVAEPADCPRPRHQRRVAALHVSRRCNRSPITVVAVVPGGHVVADHLLAEFQQRCLVNPRFEPVQMFLAKQRKILLRMHPGFVPQSLCDFVAAVVI